MSIDGCFYRTRLHPKTVQHSSKFQRLIFILKLCSTKLSACLCISFFVFLAVYASFTHLPLYLISLGNRYTINQLNLWTSIIVFLS